MTESALCLTDDEWSILALVCSHYLNGTVWANHETRLPGADDVRQRRELCKRIVAVVDPPAATRST